MAIDDDLVRGPAGTCVASFDRTTAEECQAIAGAVAEQQTRQGLEVVAGFLAGLPEHGRFIDCWRGIAHRLNGGPEVFIC